MDQCYLGDIPRHKAALRELKREFTGVASRTDWTKLRIDPLLAYVTTLERLLRSPRFARETKRLRQGVAMFHSDLVHLRTNIQALRAILADEHRRLGGGPVLRKRPRRTKP